MAAESDTGIEKDIPQCTICYYYTFTAGTGEINSKYKVFSMGRREEGITCDKMQGYYGLDADAFLEEAFQTDCVSRVIKEKVNQMYDCIEQRDFEQAEKYIKEIESLTENRNADIVRGKVLIRKGKRVNVLDKEET